MTREELIQSPDYWRILYENECERLGIKPILMFAIDWSKASEDDKSRFMTNIMDTK